MALVLKAVAEGRVSNLDDPIGAYVKSARDTEIAPVTLRSLLDMRSGISFEKPENSTHGNSEQKVAETLTYNPFGNLARLHVNGPEAILHQIKYKETEKGQFLYQNLNTALLGLVLESIYNKSLDELLFQKIWSPAGASEFRWRRYAKHKSISPYCCLYATPKDWALVADFLMNNGVAQDFLPIDLFDYYLGRDLSYEEIRDGEYRNHNNYDVLDRDGEAINGPFLYFMGQGGQVIYLLPQEQLVVVRFGVEHQLLHSTLYSAAAQQD